MSLSYDCTVVFRRLDTQHILQERKTAPPHTMISLFEGAAFWSNISGVVSYHDNDEVRCKQCMVITDYYKLRRKNCHKGFLGKLSIYPERVLLGVRFRTQRLNLLANTLISERAMQVFPWFSGKIWVYAARPDKAALLASLHLRFQGASDFKAVFTGGWPIQSTLITVGIVSFGGSPWQVASTGWWVSKLAAKL